MVHKTKLTLCLNDWIINLVTFEVSSKQLSQHSLIMECEEGDDLWKRQSVFGSDLHLTRNHISLAEDRTVFTQLCAVHTGHKVPSCAEAQEEECFF